MVAKACPAAGAGERHHQVAVAAALAAHPEAIDGLFAFIDGCAFIGPEAEGELVEASFHDGPGGAEKVRAIFGGYVKEGEGPDDFSPAPPQTGDAYFEVATSGWLGVLTALWDGGYDAFVYFSLHSAWFPRVIDRLLEVVIGRWLDIDEGFFSAPDPQDVSMRDYAGALAAGALTAICQHKAARDVIGPKVRARPAVEAALQEVVLRGIPANNGGQDEEFENIVRAYTRAHILLMVANDIAPDAWEKSPLRCLGCAKWPLVDGTQPVSGPPSPSLAKCSGCRHVVFCSRECQKAVWKAHKRVCKANAPASVPKLK